MKFVQMHLKKILLVLGLAAFWTGCSFAPHYTRPAVETPAAFKENSNTNNTGTNIWQAAQPNDAVIRSNWWETFNDTQLNSLEVQVAVSNQNVVAAFENFLAAHQIVREAQAQYYPTLTFNPAVTKQREYLGGVTVNQGSSVPSRSPYVTTYALPLDASWQPDLWGNIRNLVKENAAQAQASAADLQNTKLSAQAELASDYFQLEGQDALEQLFDDTVNAYSNSVKLTQVLFKTGIDSEQDVAQAETQLKTAEAEGTNLRIMRAQLEHAIAVLIGKPPETFSIPRSVLNATPPPIPVGIPSQLLQRRPDVASAERAVMAANAQIGIGRAAYFPNITLSASGGLESATVSSLFDWSSRVWSIGAGLSQTVFDAGLRYDTVAQYKAQYNASVAQYRQTVLTALQQVEDNLVALGTLKTEIQQQDDAVTASQKYLDLAMYRYKLGIDSYLNVVIAQTSLLNNRQTQENLYIQQMTAAVQLVNDLGGGWDVSQLPKN
jgi:NodT family efflux transporter outer membrane factor (OMF) lipoprotein